MFDEILLIYGKEACIGATEHIYSIGVRLKKA